MHPSSTNLSHTKVLITNNGKKKLIQPIPNLFTASTTSHWVTTSMQGVWAFKFPVHSSCPTQVENAHFRAAYEQYDVFTKWQHHAEKPGADFSHLPTKEIGGCHWASAAPAVEPRGPGPSALLATWMHLAKPHWNRPRSSVLCWSLQYLVAPANSTYCTSAQRQNYTYGVLQLPGNSGHGLGRLGSPTLFLQTSPKWFVQEVPGWCLTHRATLCTPLMSWYSKDNSIRLSPMGRAKFSKSMMDITKADCSQMLPFTLASVCILSHDQYFSDQLLLFLHYTDLSSTA